MYMASGRSSGSGITLKLRLPGIRQWFIKSFRPPLQRRVRDGFSPSSLLKRFRYLSPPSYSIDSMPSAGWPFSVM
jgi:hypothetical protein